MKKLIIISFILFVSIAFYGQNIENQLGSSGHFLLNDDAGNNFVDGGTLGPRIDVAVSATLSEEDPSVAFCNGVFLVVCNDSSVKNTTRSF